MTKIYGFVQLIIMCTTAAYIATADYYVLHCAISIDSYVQINRFYSLIIFSLLITTAFQLAYRKHHSTESALPNIHNHYGILLNMAKGSVTVL